MTISALPAQPSRNDTPDVFVAKADAWVAALANFVAEINAMGTALNLATTTTSSSSVLIGTGAKTFTVPAGLGFTVGMSLSIANSSTNNMFGQVTSYSSTTLTMNITSVIGSGTFASWSIALAAASIGASLTTNTFSGVQNFAQGTDIASAATINLTTATGNIANVTGTTPVSAVTLGAGMTRLVRYTGACPLTYHSTNHNLNTNGQSITLDAGDFVFYQNLSGVIYGLIIKSSGAPVVEQSKIQSIAASVATNNLTASINPFLADFRSSTLSNGIPVSRTLSSVASVVAPSGATFGAPAVVTVSSATAAASTTLTLNAGPSSPVQVGDTLFISGAQSAKVASFGTYVGGTGTGTVILDTAVTVTAAAVVFSHPTRLLLLAIDNAGTLEAALVNQAGGLSLDETGLISTTAISASATSATTIYSTTARSNVAYKVMGFIDVVQAANGVYAVAPVLVQGATASAMAAMFSAGNGQTWQNVASQRVVGLTYFNTTGKPISVDINGSSGSSAVITLTINGITLQGQAGTATTGLFISAIVPPGHSYIASVSAGALTVGSWTELR